MGSYEETELFKKHNRLIYLVINRLGLTLNEDLFQTGSIGLLQAIRTFEPNKGTFSTYATKCIANSIIRTYNVNKRKTLFNDSAISLDEIVYENSKDRSKVRLMDTIADDKYEISEQLYELTGCHTFDKFITNIKQLNILSEFEMKALHLHLLGYSHIEIGEILNKTQSTANRAYQRALNKIRKYYHII